MNRKAAEWMLASIVTPWVLFVTTANALFLANQEDLGYDLRYLLPFLAVFVVSAGLGRMFLGLAARRHAAWPLIWAYLIAGIAALSFIGTSGNATLERYQVAWVLSLASSTVGVAYLLRGRSPARGAPLFALLAIVLVVTDAFQFVGGYQFSVPDRAASAPASGRGGTTIYHLILDGYQADIFPSTLDDSIRQELNGFTLFNDNITVSGRTRISIPSVFGGRIWDNDDSIAEFTAEAMNSPRSLLAGLREAGYTTTAYLHKRFSFEPNLFDETFYHHNASRDHGQHLQGSAFFDLWIYRFVPHVLSDRILGDETRLQILNRSLSPDNYAAVSYDVFRDFIAREGSLPPDDRYVFVHLILPHHPYVLDRNCEYRRHLPPIEQFNCGTRVIRTLVSRLKEIGRYDDAMIIAHGDHGMNFDVQPDGTLMPREFNPGGVAWNLPRSRAMLLVKPPHAGKAALVETNVATTLLDITPTVYRAAGIEAPLILEGQPLFPLETRVARTRYYHYFVSDYTEELYRFAVNDGFEFDRIVRPTGFHAALPVVAPGQIIEAEDTFIPDVKRTEIATTLPGVSGAHVESGRLFFKVRVEQSGDYE